MSDAFKRFETDGWNAAAGTYDSLTGRATTFAFDPLLDLARVGAGARVLDLGCGTGGLTRAAADRGADAVGIDLADAMLDAARSAHPACAFVTGDAEDPPFEAGRFEAVLGAFVLNHVPDPERCAAEAARVAAPGGAVAFALWERPERARLTSLLAEAADRAGLDRAAGVPDGPDDARYADPAEMTALLRDAGLEEIETRTLDVTVVVSDTDQLWDDLLGGTVRSAAAIRAQDEDGLARTRVEFDRIAAGFVTDEGSLRVPTAIAVGCGRRPAG